MTDLHTRISRETGEMEPDIDKVRALCKGWRVRATNAENKLARLYAVGIEVLDDGLSVNEVALARAIPGRTARRTVQAVLDELRNG